MKTFIYTKTEKNASYGTKVTLTVYRVKNNMPIYLGEVKYNTGSYRGEDHELVKWLSENKHLPKKAVDNGGYRNFTFVGYNLHRI